MTARGRLVAAVTASVGLFLLAAVSWKSFTPPASSGVTPPPPPPSTTPAVATPPDDWLTSAAPLPLPTHRGREADRQEGTIRHLAYSPDGRTLATAGTEEVWEHPPGSNDSVFRPFDVVQLSDAHSGEVRLLLDGFAGTVRAVAFSSDSRVLAVAAGRDRPQGGQLTLWNVATGQLVRAVEPLPEVVTAVAFHPDGRRLAFACGGAVTLWDAPSGTGSRLHGPAAHAGVTSLAFNADGSRLAAGIAATAVEWQLPAGTFGVRSSRLTPGRWDGGLAFDGDTLITRLARCEAQAGQKLPLPTSATAAALSTDGKRVAWVDDANWTDDELGFVWTTPKLWAGDVADLGRVFTWDENLKRMKDAPHRATRLEAIRWLKKHRKDPRTKAAMTALEERLLRDAEWRVRERAASRMVWEVGMQFKDDPPPLALLTAFRDPDRCVRVAARFRITAAKAYPTGAMDELLKATTFADGHETRAEAVYRLVESFKDDPRAVTAIAAALKDPHPVVRLRAQRAHYLATRDLAPLVRYWLRYTDGTDTEWPQNLAAEADDFLADPDYRRASRNLYQVGFASFMHEVTAERPAECAAEVMMLLSDPTAAVRIQAADRVGMFARSASQIQAFEAVIPQYLLLQRLTAGGTIPDDPTTLRGDVLLTTLLKVGVAARLTEMAKDDPDEEVRTMAAFALDRLFPSSRK